MSRQILILDSTQLSTFYECPQKWDYAWNQNLELKTLAEKEDDSKTAGSYGHKLLELYYRHKDKNVIEAVATAKSYNPSVEENLSEDMIAAVKRQFDLYWQVYCHRDIEPLTRRKHSVIVEDGLLKDKYEDEPLVEQGFSYDLFTSPEYIFVLEGKIDLIGMFSGNMVFMDHKFQFRQRALYKKSIQFRNYALASNLRIGIINYIRFHKDMTNKTFERDIITFEPSEMKMWRGELIDKFVEIAKVIKKGEFEKNRDSCAGKYGYPCQFTPLCEDASFRREALKEAYYTIKKEWKPW